MNEQLTAALDAWSAEDTKARRAGRATAVRKAEAAQARACEAWQAVNLLARKAKLAHTLDGAPADPAIAEAERDAWSKYKAAQLACLALNTLKRGETKGGY